MKKIAMLLMAILLLSATVCGVSALTTMAAEKPITISLVEIKSSLSKTEFLSTEKLTVNFTFDGNAKNCRYEVNNVELIHIKTAKNKITVDLYAKESEGQFRIFIDFDDGYQTDTVYTYSDCGMVFASDLSEDTAWLAGLKYKLDQGLITNQEANRAYSEYSRKHADFEMPANQDSSSAGLETHAALKAIQSTSSGNTTVKGKIEYQYRKNPKDTTIVSPEAIAADTVKIPLKNIKVRLIDSDWIVDDHIGEKYTDEKGEYEFKFNNGSGLFEFKNDVFIRIFSSGQTFNVFNFANYNFLTHITNIFSGDFLDFSFSYHIDSSAHKNIATGSTTVINAVIKYNDNNLTNKAFSVSHALSAAQDFAQNAGDMKIDGKVYVYFPFDPDIALANLATSIEDAVTEIGSLFHEDFDATGFLDFLRNTPLSNITAFCYNRIMCLREIYWNNYDTIMHEYGHFIEWRMNTYGPLTKLMIWEHFSGHDIHDDDIFEKGKEFGMDLAWIEGWGYAFASLSLNYNTALHSIPNVADSFNSGRSYYFLNFTPNDNSGEAQEGNIAAFLLDLYHPNKPDGLKLGYNEFFETSAKSGTFTMHDFAQNLQDKYPNKRDEIGQRMSKYQIAPKVLNVPDTHDIYTPPTISWQGNGSKNNPNNIFEIVFYDKDGNKRFSTGKIERNSTSLTFSRTTGSSTTKNCDPHATSEICHRCTISYTLTIQQWKNVLLSFSSSANSNMYITVKGYEKTKVDNALLSFFLGEYYETGPYTSGDYVIKDYFGVKFDGTEYYLANRAYENSTVQIKNIPNGVTKIGSYAFKNCKSLTTIIIPNSVTSIGDSAFAGCSSLTSVTIPSGVTSIEDSTFASCPSLTNITIPDSVTSIGHGAFSHCSSLTNITLPPNLTNIGDYAFNGCGNLTSISIPAGVTNINYTMFSKCSKLSKLTIAGENSIYKSDGNCIIKKSNDELVAACNGSSIPGYVERIGEHAFEYIEMYSLTIPASVKSIGEWCFGNSNIQYITFAENSQLASIGNSVFYGSALISIIIPDSVKTIGNLAFGYCKQLQNVWISPDSKLYSISGGAFFECTSLREIVFPNSLISIESRAFYHCESLANVKFYSPEESKLSFIGYGAFLRASSLTSMVIPASVTRIEGVSPWQPESEFFGRVSRIYYCGTNSSAWNKLFRSEYEMPISGTLYYYLDTTPHTEGRFWHNYKNPEIWREGVKDGLVYTLNSDNVTYSVKAQNTSITSANIQNRFNGYSVTAISASGFAGCSVLTSITIPTTVTTIGASAFSACNKLTIYAAQYSASIPTGWHSSWNSLNRPVFWGCTLYPYVNSFTKTQDSISNFNAINGISDPSREEYIFDGWHYYVGTDLVKYSNSIVNAPDGITYYAKWIPTYLDVGFNLDGGIGNYPIIRVYNGMTVSEPTDVPEKEGCYFKFWALSTNKTQAYNWDNPVISDITLIAIWGEITYNYSLINNGQEYEISKGTINPNGIVVIPKEYNNRPVTKIANNAFYGSALTTIIIPASITSIGDNAFYGCTNLKNITFEKGSLLTNIGNNAFYNCSVLTEIDIPERVASIGSKAFANTGLSKMLIPNNLANVSANAFEGTGITNIVKWTGLSANGISATVTTDEITLTFDKELMGLDMFSNITIPRATISALNSSEFSYTLSIFDLITCNEGILTVSLTAPVGVALIGGTKTVTTFDATVYTDNLAFSLINDGTAYEVSVGSALNGDNTIILIPPVYNGLLVTKIADNGFEDCIGITKVVIPSSVKNIGNYSFSGCTGLTSISLPKSLVAIGNYAFYNCTTLAGIDLPDGLTNIGNYAFYNCTTLAGIDLPYSLRSIGDYAFFNCIELTEVVIPYGTTYVGWFAFYGCVGLTNVYLPSSLDVIELAAFAGCSGLTSIIIPEGVTRINSYAFKDCVNLTNVVIPNSLVSIGSSPFFNCPAGVEFPPDVPSFGPGIIFWP